MSMAQALTLFLVLGVAQGLFLALLLLTRRENAAANRILAGALVAFAIFLAEAALYAGNHYRGFPHLIGISQPVVFLFGPAIYLYVREVGGEPVRPGWIALLHFAPAAVVVLYFLPFYASSGSHKIAFLETLLRDGAPLDVRIVEWLKLPHGAAYTLATFGALRRYRRRLEDNFSTLDRINLGWLRNLMIGVLITWGVAITYFVLNLLGMGVRGVDWSPVSLVLVVVLYMIGILGLRQPEVFWPAVLGDPREEATAAVEPSADEPKYRKSGLDPERAAAIEQALTALMSDEQPQNDADLTLQQLADRLAVSPHNLSEVINARVGTTFHDFVNGYRVEEARRRLVDPATAHLTILAIALESGFRSKSTFNKVFKRFTGVTPSEFRREAVRPRP
jgi:AraC-like DNA-binding protein